MRSGISVPMCLTCTACGQSTATQRSKLKYGDGKARREELNTRSVLAMHSVGCGQSSLRKFCGIMDLPTPLLPSNYQKHTKAGSRRKHESGSKESTYRHTEKKVTFWMSPFHVMVPWHVEYLHHYMVL